MLRIDRQALICDLAEVYHIYDYRSLPARTVATFAVGLGPDSRIKMKLRGDKISSDKLLKAMMVDKLSEIVYILGATEASERPVSITRFLLGIEEPKSKEDHLTFSSAEEFEKTREKILGKEGEVCQE